MYKIHSNQLYIPSFCLRDNSVHLQDCSPFWVDIFIINKNTLPYLLFDVDMRILIDKALEHFICYRKVYFYVNMDI